MAEIDKYGSPPKSGIVDSFPSAVDKAEKLREFAAAEGQVINALNRVSIKYTKAMEDISSEYNELNKHFENLKRLAVDIGVPVDQYPMNFCYGAELLRMFPE